MRTLNVIKKSFQGKRRPQDSDLGAPTFVNPALPISVFRTKSNEKRVVYMEFHTSRRLWLNVNF